MGEHHMWKLISDMVPLFSIKGLERSCACANAECWHLAYRGLDLQLIGANWSSYWHSLDLDQAHAASPSTDSSTERLAGAKHEKCQAEQNELRKGPLRPPPSLGVVKGKSTPAFPSAPLGTHLSTSHSCTGQDEWSPRKSQMKYSVFGAYGTAVILPSWSRDQYSSTPWLGDDPQDLSWFIVACCGCWECTE